MALNPSNNSNLEQLALKALSINVHLSVRLSVWQLPYIELPSFFHQLMSDASNSAAKLPKMPKFPQKKCVENL